ncbi:hypothetical protein [Streptomyces sp. NPDC013455]|uniref:hypothetical protein n=1 Tax=Streptomyces sp. NPDC013455 TaxID=3155605 RepID=UPI0033F97129
MLLVPGWMWQRGPVTRAAGAGLASGVFFGAFVLVEAGSWAGAAVVFLVLCLLHGFRVPRRMNRIWPEGRHLDTADRTAVVRATRRGEAIGDPRLAPSVLGYADALRRTAEEDRIRRWVIPVVTVLSVGLAVYDTLESATGEMIASWLLVALLLAELVWWPRRVSRLLASADRAEAAARRMTDAGHAAGDT